MRYDVNIASKRVVAWLRAWFLLVIGVCEILRFSATIISLPLPSVLKRLPKTASGTTTGHRRDSLISPQSRRGRKARIVEQDRGIINRFNILLCGFFPFPVLLNEMVYTSYCSSVLTPSVKAWIWQSKSTWDYPPGGRLPAGVRSRPMPIDSIILYMC